MLGRTELTPVDDSWALCDTARPKRPTKWACTAQTLPFLPSLRSNQLQKFLVCIIYNQQIQTICGVGTPVATPDDTYFNLRDAESHSYYVLSQHRTTTDRNTQPHLSPNRPLQWHKTDAQRSPGRGSPFPICCTSPTACRTATATTRPPEVLFTHLPITSPTYTLCAVPLFVSASVVLPRCVCWSQLRTSVPRSVAAVFREPWLVHE